jgi:hypothetical protein
LAVLVVAILILKCRVRLHLTSDEKKLFIGLGRTGPEFDLANETSTLRLFGFPIRTLTPGKIMVRAMRPRLRRLRRPTLSIGESVEMAGHVLKALWTSQRSLLRNVKVEELKGELVGGFDSPDQTGIVYGCYQAALGIMPQIRRRLIFVPYWQGSHFGGTLNASVAIPLYRVIYELIATVLRLPLRKFVRLTIGRKKGVRDVQ